MPRKLFVTTALPYANGAFHIGHIMEYIQADIWVRLQRMLGNEVHFVCADDAHGAPIMIAAEKAGLSPQEFVARIAAGRKQYLDGFHIGFDNWHSTDGAENHQLAQDIYLALRRQGLIAVRAIEQFYDPVKGMFLPDRYIKGECPKCGAKDQYGDSCEVCGAVYAPTELKNPYSTLTGATPVMKSSEHHFFQLSSQRCIDFLQQWTHDPGRLQGEVLNKIREWFATDDEGHVGLSDWDISRDAPYFGIRIPDTEDKYFYVWLDAPVGYLASLKNYCAKSGRDYDALMKDPALEQIHFIGKDITYFHTLFWPAMLHFSGRKTPDKVFVHGFITVNGGEKMSKSRGTGISPLKYLELGMNAEWLRYYIAAKLNAKVEDIDFNPDDFVARVNSDLVGKYINIASRAAGFLAKRFGGHLSADIGVEGRTLLDALRAQRGEVERLYEEREYGKALREIMLLADRVNEYVDAHKPWELAKKGENETLDGVLSFLYRALSFICELAAPYIPGSIAAIRAQLGDGKQIGEIKPVFPRLDPAIVIPRMQELEQQELARQKALMGQATEAPVAATPVSPLEPEITIDDFVKVDLRVGLVLEAAAVKGADKLLHLKVDIGEAEPRSIVAGIAKAYAPETLVNRKVVIVANLAPRKLRGLTSQGMIVAASLEGGKPTLAGFLEDVPVGARLK